jgi:hypothetical protein
MAAGSESPDGSELSEPVDGLDSGFQASDSRGASSKRRPPAAADGPRAVKAKRALDGIDGLCRRRGEIFALVRFAGSPKREAVPLQTMHRCYLRELLSFYEISIIPPPG